MTMCMCSNENAQMKFATAVGGGRQIGKQIHLKNSQHKLDNVWLYYAM